jgi:hypothetical protein
MRDITIFLFMYYMHASALFVVALSTSWTLCAWAIASKFANDLEDITEGIEPPAKRRCGSLGRERKLKYIIEDWTKYDEWHKKVRMNQGTVTQDPSIKP